MTFFQGFVVPVPSDKKEAYRQMAAEAAPLFEEFGARRIVECWGDDVPRGEITDMYGAVEAVEGENLVFAWIDWDSEEACAQAHDEMMKDERMQEPPSGMPFDGKRMIFAGFEQIGVKGDGGETGYLQAYVAPAAIGEREAYSEMMATIRDIAVDAGALRAVDGWSDRIEDGKLTDFKRAVKAEEGEAVAVGFTEWSSKAAAQRGLAKMRDDSRMPPPGSDMPFDGQRMIFGGFVPIVSRSRPHPHGGPR